MAESNNALEGSKKGISRRDFLKYSAAAGIAATAVDWVATSPKAYAAGEAPDYVVRNICPYCSIGCGIKIAVKDPDSTPFSGDEEIVDIYGDETSVLNNGALCSKGSALLQLATSPERQLEPKIKYNGVWYKHSAGGQQGWAEILGKADIDLASWVDETTGAAGSGTIYSAPRAMGKARLEDPDTMAFWGSSHMTNEECFLYRKFITAFGTNNTEHQARI